MSRDDPYHDRKPYHLAKLVSQNGDVSPLCADQPRPLNLTRELWTLSPDAVTCPKCRWLLESPAAPAGEAGQTGGGGGV